MPNEPPQHQKHLKKLIFPIQTTISLKKTHHSNNYTISNKYILQIIIFFSPLYNPGNLFWYIILIYHSDDFWYIILTTIFFDNHIIVTSCYSDIFHQHYIYLLNLTNPTHKKQLKNLPIFLPIQNKCLPLHRRNGKDSLSRKQPL